MKTVDGGNSEIENENCKKVFGLCPLPVLQTKIKLQHFGNLIFFRFPLGPLVEQVSKPELYFIPMCNSDDGKSKNTLFLQIMKSHRQ
jgi:hypothetical protein